jgi:hypothetical protein
MSMSFEELSQEDQDMLTEELEMIAATPPGSTR